MKHAYSRLLPTSANFKRNRFALLFAVVEIIYSDKCADIIISLSHEQIWKCHNHCHNHCNHYRLWVFLMPMYLHYMVNFRPNEKLYSKIWFHVWMLVVRMVLLALPIFVYQITYSAMLLPPRGTFIFIAYHSIVTVSVC